MAYNLKDFYYHKAKEQNYVARSAFKLEEIDLRYRLLRPGQKILDLGAAPGSWSQFASKKIGKTGKILGIDLQPVRVTLQNAVFVTADLRDLNLEETLSQTQVPPPFDIVMSDMAPRTTGIKLTDQVRSMELCQLALETAVKFSKKDGVFICKMFHSDDFEEFRNQVKDHYQKVLFLRPKSTRKESKEIFFIATGFNEKK